jgi:hypothetical protein
MKTNILTNGAGMGALIQNSFMASGYGEGIAAFTWFENPLSMPFEFKEVET